VANTFIKDGNSGLLSAKSLCFPVRKPIAFIAAAGSAASLYNVSARSISLGKHSVPPLSAVLPYLWDPTYYVLLPAGRSFVAINSPEPWSSSFSPRSPSRSLDRLREALGLCR